jgi:hypothetical protein
MRIALTALVGIVLAAAASFGVYAASQPSATPATTNVVQYAPPAN